MEETFNLDYPREDGSTLRDHLSAIEKVTGKKMTELETTPIPAAGRHVWDAFFELSATRINNSAISYQEIKAYNDLTLAGLTWWDIQAIKTLDAKYQELHTKMMRRGKK